MQNKKNKLPLSNIDLINYFHGQTPTDASKVVTLLYISEELNYKICKDLQVYKPKELESTFIKIITKNRKNLIVGCVRNILLLITKIIDLYILPLLEKLSCETKQVMLMGDFNMNLFNYNTNKTITEFVDVLCTNSCIPYINLPTRITNQAETLIGNFYNKIQMQLQEI